MDWQPIETAPKDATEIEALVDGKIMVIHWAEDRSGSEQPPFWGWFYKAIGNYYDEVEGKIEGWRPISR